MDLSWFYDDDVVDGDELSDLYRIAPLGERSPGDLATVFSWKRQLGGWIGFLRRGDTMKQLDIDQLRAEFNRASESVRIVSVFSPT